MEPRLSASVLSSKSIVSKDSSVWLFFHSGLWMWRRKLMNRSFSVCKEARNSAKFFTPEPELSESLLG